MNIRSKMNWHRVIVLFVFVSMFSKGRQFTNNGKPKTIKKCCPQGMQFDGEVSSCINVDGWNISNIQTDLFYPPIDTDTHYWIHPNLSVLTLIATYDTLSKYKHDVASINFLQNLVFKPRDYSGEIPEKLIRSQIYCYDRMPNSEHPYVQFESTVLNPIYKCCAKGERLNAQANGCERFSNLSLEEVEDEVVGLPRNSEYYQWLPANTSEFILKLKYNTLKSGFSFNTVIPQNSDFVWNVVKTESDRYTGISFRGRDETGKVAGETDIFCFDEVLDGSRVLLAGVYDVYKVYKCCGKGEELGDIKRVCEPRHGENVQNIKNDIVEWRNNSRDAYWMPDSLQYGDIAVQYDMIFKMSFHSDPKGWAFDENLWQLEPGKGLELPRILYNMTDISGNTVAINTPFFCFDSIKNSAKKVAIMHIKNPLDYIRKCCLPGEVFSPSGVCENHHGEDWSPEISSVKSMFNDSIPKDNIIIPLKWFCSWSFTIYPLNASRAISHYRGNHFQKEDRVVASFCNDFQRTEEGLKEVAASCEDPPYIKIYEKFILLDGVAAGLLVAAAFVAASRKEMRRSAHGCALACHAISLAVVHSMQIASFLNFSSLYNPCTTTMVLTTYFFMVAANWWLSVITFSMFYNFRQPLGALAHKDGGASMWVRFAIMSSVAWSGSAALTTLAALMNKYSVKMMFSGVITPNFLETRTCVFDNTYYGDEAGLHPTPLNHPYGSVFYYLIPMIILALSNGVWVVLTANRLRNLRRGNSILRRSAAEAAEESTTSCIPSEHLQSVLMYAKLLLSTGIAELTLEVMAWVFGRRTKQFYSAWKTLIVETEREYVYSSAATVLDLIRALIVFWMTTGGLWNFRMTIEWIRQRLEFVLRRQKRRVGASQETPTVTARGKNPDLKLKEMRSNAKKPKTHSH